MFIPRYKETLLFLKGYNKVLLRDTRGVLNKTNNHKYVRIELDKITTILPSGTKVIEMNSEINNLMKVKYIVKPNKDYIYSRRNNSAKVVLKNNQILSMNTNIEDDIKTLGNKRTQKKSLLLPDGSIVNQLFGKYSKLVAWERIGNGKNISVQITRLFNSSLGSVFLRKEGQIYSSKTVSKYGIPSVKITKCDLTDPNKILVETVTKFLDRRNKKLLVKKVQTKQYDSSIGIEFERQKNFIRMLFDKNY